MYAALLPLPMRRPPPPHPPVARVLDEPYSQLSTLSGVAVQARQST